MKQNTIENKIKLQLFKKILEKDNIENKIAEIESRYELSDQSIDTNEEYGELCCEMQDLESEIDRLLIETLYTPLVGLSDIEKQKIDFSNISHSLDYDKIAEKYFDMELLNFKDNMKKRLKRLKGLYLTAKVDDRIVMLYKEIARCYIYGCFAASTALCRALVESVAEGYSRQEMEARKKIDSAKSFEKRKILYAILEKKTTRKLCNIYSVICGKGASVLHWRRDKVNEDESLKIIELSQKFINEIYKTPDFSHLVELV